MYLNAFLFFIFIVLIQNFGEMRFAKAEEINYCCKNVCETYTENVSGGSNPFATESECKENTGGDCYGTENPFNCDYDSDTDTGNNDNDNDDNGEDDNNNVDGKETDTPDPTGK